MLHRQLLSFLSRLLLVSAVLLPVATGAIAQAAYPNKPITLVVGYPPGGSTDLVGRVLGTELARILGVAVVVENIGGAGGTLGLAKVINAAPDGYTLLVGSNNETAISRLVSSTTKADWRDLSPIGMIASLPMVLVASQASQVRTFEQFLDTVKRQPGKFSYGSSGVGTALHLAGEMVKDQGGLFMTHIPYRGVAPLTNDLMGNNIEFGVFVLSSALPHIKSGKLAALGTTELKRNSATPNVPAIAENPRFKNIDISSWFALMAPAKLPAPVASRLQAALTLALDAPALRTKLIETGATIAAPNVDMPKFLAEETAKYQKIVDFAKIKE